MKRQCLILLFWSVSVPIFSQMLRVVTGKDTVSFAASPDEMVFSDNGTVLTIYSKSFFINEIDKIYIDTVDLDADTYNFNFEKPIDFSDHQGWDAPSGDMVYYVEYEGRNGSACVKIVPSCCSPFSSSSVSQTVSGLSEGSFYRFSCYVRTEGKGNGPVGITVRGMCSFIGETFAAATKNEWTRLSVDFVALSDEIILCLSAENLQDGAVWFDDVSFESIDQ